MACDADALKLVPLFSLLDDEERDVLAAHVDVRHFGANQRIYKRGDPGGRGYVLIEGRVRVTLIDEDHQEVTVDEPAAGEFFGFASLLDGTPHQTNATSLEPIKCLEIDRHDLRTLLHKKPDAGIDMLAMLGRQFHAAQDLVRIRSLRDPNEVIERQSTLGDRIADGVARFGGSWRFIISFGVVLVVYTACNVALGGRAWDPYPAQPFSVDVGGDSGTGDHDEPESARYEGPGAGRVGFRCEPARRARDPRAEQETACAQRQTERCGRIATRKLPWTHEPMTGGGRASRAQNHK